MYFRLINNICKASHMSKGKVNYHFYFSKKSLSQVDSNFKLLYSKFCKCVCVVQCIKGQRIHWIDFRIFLSRFEYLMELEGALESSRDMKGSFTRVLFLVTDRKATNASLYYTLSGVSYPRVYFPGAYSTNLMDQ